MPASDYTTCPTCGASVPDALWGVHQEKHATEADYRTAPALDVDWQATAFWFYSTLVGVLAGVAFSILV